MPICQLFWHVVCTVQTIPFTFCIVAALVTVVISIMVFAVLVIKWAEKRTRHSLYIYKNPNIQTFRVHPTVVNTYLHCPSCPWQSNPSYRHPGLLHWPSHFPSLKYRQHCRAAEQFCQGSSKFSEQSPPSQPQAWLLHSESQMWLPAHSSHWGISQLTSTSGGGVMSRPKPPIKE